MKISFELYCIIGSVTILLLYAIFSLTGGQKKEKKKSRPEIEPLKLFKGNTGLDNATINEKYKVKI